MIQFNDLMKAVEQLSHEQKRALKQHLEELEVVETAARASQLKPRTPNLHPGLVWMSEDFDDPLPDEFGLSEDS